MSRPERPVLHRLRQAILARALSYVQWGIIGGAICAERLLPALGSFPEVLQAVKDKRIGVIALTWCALGPLCPSCAWQ